MNLIIVLWLLAMSFGFWICFVSAQANKSRQQKAKRTYKKTTKHRDEKLHQEFARIAKSPRNRPRHKVKKISKRSKEWKKLMELVRYDQKTARRLIQYAKDCNPGKSDKWALEKAVWDLERDRC